MISLSQQGKEISNSTYTLKFLLEINSLQPLLEIKFLKDKDTFTLGMEFVVTIYETNYTFIVSKIANHSNLVTTILTCTIQYKDYPSVGTNTVSQLLTSQSKQMGFTYSKFSEIQDEKSILFTSPTITSLEKSINKYFSSQGFFVLQDTSIIFNPLSTLTTKIKKEFLPLKLTTPVFLQKEAVLQEYSLIQDKILQLNIAGLFTHFNLLDKIILPVNFTGKTSDEWFVGKFEHIFTLKGATTNIFLFQITN